MQLCAGDPRAERDARQLKALRQSEGSVLAMQAILLEMAQVEAQRQRQAEDFPDHVPPNNRLPALGRTHAAVTRMLHKNIEEENRIDDARLDRLAGVARAAKEGRVQKARRETESASWRRNHAGDAHEVIEDMIEAEVGDDVARADTMLRVLPEILDTVSHKDDFLNMTIGQVAEQVCANLGFVPDWTAWAEEDWAEEERHIEGSPYGPEPKIVQDADGRLRFSSQRPATGPP